MALAICDAQVGAQVAHMFDEAGRTLRVVRRGIVVGVVSQSGMTFNDNSGLKEVWVSFQRGDLKGQKIPAAQLVLHKPYDSVGAGKLKQDRINAAVDSLGEAAPDEPVLIVDKLDAPKEGFSEHNIAELGKRRKT